MQKLYRIMSTIFLGIACATVALAQAPAGFEGLEPEYYEPYNKLPVTPALLNDARNAVRDTAFGGDRSLPDFMLMEAGKGIIGYIWVPQGKYGFIGFTGNDKTIQNADQRLRLRLYFDEALKQIGTMGVEMGTRGSGRTVPELMYAYYQLLEPSLYDVSRDWKDMNPKTAAARWFTYQFVKALKEKDKEIKANPFYSSFKHVIGWHLAPEIQVPKTSAPVQPISSVAKVNAAKMHKQQAKAPVPTKVVSVRALQKKGAVKAKVVTPVATSVNPKATKTLPVVKKAGIQPVIVKKFMNARPVVAKKPAGDSAQQVRRPAPVPKAAVQQKQPVIARGQQQQKKIVAVVRQKQIPAKSGVAKVQIPSKDKNGSIMKPKPVVKASVLSVSKPVPVARPAVMQKKIPTTPVVRAPKKRESVAVQAPIIAAKATSLDAQKEFEQSLSQAQTAGQFLKAINFVESQLSAEDLKPEFQYRYDAYVEPFFHNIKTVLSIQVPGKKFDNRVSLVVSTLQDRILTNMWKATSRNAQNFNMIIKALENQ